MIYPTINEIKLAHERIKGQIHRTPLMSSSQINEVFGAELYFKCENFQKVGAFKFRGASNAVLSLTEAEAVCGVATHSSGNHAAALALAARMRGIKAHIVMPNNSPDVKKKAVAGYGADITYCDSTLQAREDTLVMIIEKSGAIFIHPYDNYNVICGQGTAALEIFEEARADSCRVTAIKSGFGTPDIVVSPVGGGGLLSGTSITVKTLSPATKVIAAEPLMADDASRSFKSGKLMPSVNPKTIADGLLTSLSPMTFGIIKENVDDILTATEESIIECMRLIWERMKIIVEPSSAVSLAIIKENPEVFRGKKVVLILTGGNVDLKKLSTFL